MLKESKSFVSTWHAVCLKGNISIYIDMATDALVFTEIEVAPRYKLISLITPFSVNFTLFTI